MHKHIVRCKTSLSRIIESPKGNFICSKINIGSDVDNRGTFTSKL